MRYLGLIIFVIMIIGGLILWNVYMTNSQSRSPEKNAETGKQLARHVDRLLIDPTLIGSSEWNNEAKRLVDNYYKGK